MVYDLIIIGAGPAGLAAAIYAARYKIDFIVIGEKVGGLLLETHKICNYPGLGEISGAEFSQKLKEHAESLGTKIVEELVNDIDKKDDGSFIVRTPSKSYDAKALIMANGLRHRKLEVPGEQEFLGKGVSYCAICDAALFRNKTVAVVGGNDSAASAAVLLAKFAKQVFIIYRKEKIRAEPAWVDEIAQTKNIEIINNSNIIKILGDKFVEAAVLDTGKEMKLDGLFIEIGAVPSTSLAKKLGLKLDSQNYLEVDNNMKTGQAMVYAAGDLTNASPLKQVVTACGQGAIAAFSAYKDLLKAKKK